MRPTPDLSLYLVVTPQLCRGRSVDWVVAEAVAGGATLVQLRDKEATTAPLVAMARQLQELLTAHGLTVVTDVNADDYKERYLKPLGRKVKVSPEERTVFASA